MEPTHSNGVSADLELLAPVQGGQMLARLEGQVVFVHGGMPGELIRSGALEQHRGYLSGEAQSVPRPAPERVAPPCPYFGENTRRRGDLIAPIAASGLVCGGCQYQHIEYAAQLEMKGRILAEQLRRVGKIVDAPVSPMIPSPAPYAYRNKAAWIVTELGHLAYHEARSHRPIAIDSCALLTPGLLALFEALRAAIATVKVAGLVHGMEARSLANLEGQEEGSLLLICDETLMREEAVTLAEILMEACPSLASVAGVGRDRDAEPISLAGRPRLETRFLDERMALSPSTFFQVNVPVAEAMARYVVEQLGTLDNRLVADVYCGAGTFTLAVARQADAVVGLDVDGGAIEDLRQSLAWTDRENVTLLHGDAGMNLRSLLPGTAACVVVDPPRTGCSPLALRQLGRVKAPRLVYISCDPSTLARDLRFLLDQGYLLESVQPFDLFPQTAHIESVSSLRLPKKHQSRG